MKCKNCNGDIDLASTFCGYCGAAVVKVPSGTPTASVPQGVTSNLTANMEGLDTYYQEVFREIEANGGKMMPKWNWWSFLFGCFWYFSKGVWAKGLIILVITIFSGGVAIPLIWIYCGLLGNYDYYLLKARNNQFW